MATAEIELSALRNRRPSPIMIWLRRRRPFDRRSIRIPAERDAYWAAVQQRLLESEASVLMRRATSPPDRVTAARQQLIGAD